MVILAQRGILRGPLVREDITYQTQKGIKILMQTKGLSLECRLSPYVEQVRQRISWIQVSLWK